MKHSLHILYKSALVIILSIMGIEKMDAQMIAVRNNIIRKTKRFDIPERAVYFLKTKRTAGGTPPPQNIFDRLTPVFT